MIHLRSEKYIALLIHLDSAQLELETVLINLSCTQLELETHLRSLKSNHLKNSWNTTENGMVNTGLYLRGGTMTQTIEVSSKDSSQKKALEENSFYLTRLLLL